MGWGEGERVGAAVRGDGWGDVSGQSAMAASDSMEAKLKDAVKEGDLEGARALVSEGASLQTHFGELRVSLAHWAAVGGHTDTLEWIVEQEPSLLSAVDEVRSV